MMKVAHMHIEFRHLRTIKAIHDTGGLARAADVLHITQSALSHQIKGIEEQAGVELFVRRSKPLKLSAAGMRLLKAAEAILPQVAALEAEFEGLVAGSSGRLHIAIECHACFEWLFPVLESFRKAWPDVDVDIRPGLAFDAAVILLLVASNRGVSVLPDWVVRQVRYNSDYVTRPITKTGITRRLYAATRSGDTNLPFMAHLIRLAKQEAVKLQRA